METGPSTRVPYIWGLLRLSVGWLTFWGFIDKLFGIGFATPLEGAWLAGASPTVGFLGHATTGPFAPLFQAIAGNPIVDALYMAGLLGVGVAMLLGIGVRIAGYSGALMMLLLWLSVLPKANNPFMDEHIVYLLVFIGLARVLAGRWLGLGKWWISLLSD